MSQQMGLQLQRHNATYPKLTSIMEVHIILDNEDLSRVLGNWA